jgi:hypothetical protein
LGGLSIQLQLIGWLAQPSDLKTVLSARTDLFGMELLKKYEDFLISNASQITSIEGTLRSITYFLPGMFWKSNLSKMSHPFTPHFAYTFYFVLVLVGRFHDAEFASQACK